MFWTVALCTIGGLPEDSGSDRRRCPVTRADWLFGRGTCRGYAEMTDTQSTGRAGNRDVRKDYPRLLSITDGRKRRDCPPRPATFSRRLSLAATPTYQTLLAAAPKFRRSSQSAFDEGLIVKATPREVRHDRVDPTKPKADAQIGQVPATSHRSRRLRISFELHCCLASTSATR